MNKRERIDRGALAKQEFSGARLGDARLESRLEQIAGLLAKRPSESLPRAMVDEASLEATYRFLGNERVSSAEILRPHRQRTQQRCREHPQVLAVFDTSELRFGGEREGLGYLTNAQSRGLLAHVGLAVSADGRREPLGTLHLETLVRKGARKHRNHAAGEADSERLRWNRGVQAVYKDLPQAICVMDREADVFDLVWEMSERGQHFVVRAAQNRNTDQGLLWELLDDMELLSTRVVELSERRARKRKHDRKKHPKRSAHAATLELRARPVVLRSPNSTRCTTPQNSSGLALHLVQVIEREPPVGDEPVQWVLLTNLPIDTQAQIDFIVDCYCARWVIEEFFKSLKSGCAFEKRQLESVASVTNALAVSLPIAWLLLRLRNLARDDPHRPAKGMLSPLMLSCLRALYQQNHRKSLPDEPTCHQLLWAIAALGGHIKNNGEPGLLVLGRGLADLIQATDIATALGLNPKM
jgi:hypothetical protein